MENQLSNIADNIINDEDLNELNPIAVKSVAEITKTLQDAGVSPSIQRIKILQFIFANEVHSSVEKIYHELVTEIPTLFNNIFAYLAFIIGLEILMRLIYMMASGGDAEEN